MEVCRPPGTSDGTKARALTPLRASRVERRWEVDESPTRLMLSTFKNPQDPLWLAVFPESTDFTEQKCIRSQKLASENGLPILKNVLLPKTKGFAACLEELRGCLDAELKYWDDTESLPVWDSFKHLDKANMSSAGEVFDVTIGYKYRCPTFLDNAFGVAPSEVHIHVRHISVNDIPTSEDMMHSA